MKSKYFFLLIFLLTLALNNYSYGQKEPFVVKVLDDKNNPVANAKVSIEKSRYYRSGKDGKFEFVPNKKLIMPFKVEVDFPEYELEEFYFMEDQKEIEVILRKTVKPDAKSFVVSVLNIDDNSPARTIKIVVDNNPYLTDNNGVFLLKGDFTENSRIECEGYEIMDLKIKSRQNKGSIFVKKNIDILPLPDTTNIFIEDSYTFEKYKEDFNRISKEIIAEKLRLEKKNLEIREEIEVITNKLRNDKTLTYDERKQLEKYLQKLERLLKENSIAFHRAEQKANLLINKLRLIILEKDSVAYLAKLKILEAEKEKKILEEQFNQKVRIFSVISGGLLFVAIVFYFISARARKQKKELEKVNKDLKVIKDELVKNVEEVSRQKAVIEEQNSQLDTFVYKASHDIKGPLRSVIGLTQTGMKMITDPVSLEFFEHILKSTQKLDNLLIDLLNLTKAKKVEVQKAEIHVLKTVKECLTSFENLVEYKNMQFDLDISDDLIFCSDEKLFYSIVQNFIENGIKYKDDKKKNPYLIISAKVHGNQLIMEFADNGLGIEKMHQSKIFDMFYKINSSSNGTGLGLHIVKLNIEKLKGNVKLVSEPGKGSTFTVTFELEPE